MSNNEYKSVNTADEDIRLGYWDPNYKPYKFVILALVCVLTFGSYFCYDIPAALQTTIEDYYKVDKFQYELLYSLYSWPNTIQVFFGGYLIDRVFGLRLGALIFCSLVLVGQIIVSVGASSKSFVLTCIGRFVFGMGGETLSVTQSAFCGKWFRGDMMALAFGIALSFSRIGSAVNMNVSPFMSRTGGFVWAIWFGAILCGLSVLGCMMLGILDKKGEGRAGVTAEAVDEEVNLSDVFFFPKAIWLIYGICVFFYVSVFIFITLGSGFFQYKYGLSPDESATILSIPYTLSAFLSPMMGFAVDKFARSVNFVVAACVMMTSAHILLLATEITPIVSMVIMGIAYSTCAAALWPSVALIVSVRQLGSAYGLMTALQNLGLATGAMGFGAIATAFGYNVAILGFVCTAGISTLMALALWINARGGAEAAVLNFSAAQLQERARKEAEEEEEKEREMEMEKQNMFADTTPLFQKRNNHLVRSNYLARLGIRPHFEVAGLEIPDHHREAFPKVQPYGTTRQTL